MERRPYERRFQWLWVFALIGSIICSIACVFSAVLYVFQNEWKNASLYSMWSLTFLFLATGIIFRIIRKR